MGRNM